MLKSLGVKKEFFAFAILMSLAIAFGFGYEQILATTVQDGQVNMELWEYTVLDDGNSKKIIQITGYSANTNLKDIVVPNANDFLANSTFTTNNSGVTASDISEVIISKAAMQKAIANANKENGKFSISQSSGAASKTITVATNNLNDLFNTDVENPTNTSQNNIGQNIKEIDLTGLDTTGVTQMNKMFYGCRSLTSLIFGNNFNTSAVTDMSWMFSGCSGLTSLDLSDFNTSAVTNMSCMFYVCSGLTSLDLSDFDTSAVMDMSKMFSECVSLTSLDLSDLDTSAVMNMSKMFSGCVSLTSLDLSDFDTSTVTDMSRMFSGCVSLTSLDLSDFDTSIVMNMSKMFDGCSSLATLTVGPSFSVSNYQNVTPTKEGYTFAGWYKDEELTNQFIFGTDTISTETTLYAKWTAKNKTVTFNSNEGSNVAAQTVLSGNKITKPNDPTKDGYMFAGWYKEEELKNKFDFDNDTITEDTTLYAKWTKKNTGNNSNNENKVSENNDFSWNTFSDSGSSSSYNATNSQNTPMSSLTSVLSQQILAKLQTRSYLKGYEDGTIKPDKGVTNAELATVLTNLVKENDEIIVQSPVWYEGSISYVLKKGIMKAEDCAKPNAFATVGQINSALDNVLRVCGANSSVANSLDASAIYGTTNTNVSLSENSQTITRGQLANMIKNKFGRSKKQVSTRIFSDLSPSHPYYDAIMDAVQ